MFTNIQYFFGVMRPKDCNFIKKNSLDFAKFLRTPFVQNISGRLLPWTTASETSNTKYLELIKRRLKVQEKNMSCESILNFDQ